MSISERIGETAAGALLPGVGDVASGKYDEVLAQSGVSLIGVEDAALSKVLAGVGSTVVAGVRRKVLNTITQTEGNTVTAADVAEAGSVPAAIKQRQRDRFQEEYVAEPIASATDQRASELASGTFEQLGYSKEQADQMVGDTVVGGLVKGAHAAGLRVYDNVAANAADLLRGRAPVSTNTHGATGGNGAGITAGDAGLSAEVLHDELQERAINDRAFAGMTGSDINDLVTGRIHSGKYDQSKNDFQRGGYIARDVASDAQAVRNLKKVYGDNASASEVLQQTTNLRGSDIRNMSASRRDALTAEAARVAENTGMDSQDMAIAAASGRAAAASQGLSREAGYRIGLSAQKQIGASDIRVEGLDTEQYRSELSNLMAEAGESGAVTDAAAAYRAYIDATGAVDSDETFAAWQKQTEDIDFSDSAQTQKYIGKTLGVSGSKAADAYDAYSRSKDTQRMAESRDFYSGALQKKVDEINKTAKSEQKKALKDAGINLDKVFDDDVEFNSMTQQERKDKIRDYAKKAGKDMVEVEAALTRSDRMFETTAEYHGLSAEAADQAIVSSRKNKDLADQQVSQHKQYSKGVEGVSQRIAENQREGRDTTISDLATAVLTGTSQEDLEKASDYIEDSLNITKLDAAAEVERNNNTLLTGKSEGNRGGKFEGLGTAQVELAKQSAGAKSSGVVGGLGSLHDAASKAISSISEKTANGDLSGALNSILETLNQIKNKLG